MGLSLVEAIPLPEAEKRLHQRWGAYRFSIGEPYPSLFDTAEVGVVTARWEGACLIESYICGEQRPRATTTKTTYSVRDGNLTIHAGDKEVELEAGKSYTIPSGIPHFASGIAYAQISHQPATNEQNFWFTETSKEQPIKEHTVFVA